MQSKRQIINLFETKEQCCACGACLNACPTNAIAMHADARGFLYPQINHELCVQCGKCKRVCNYQQNNNSPATQVVYASMLRDASTLKRSSSGGAFAAVAKNVLNSGGVVFGCAMSYKKGKLYPEHIMIDQLQDLHRLQGSKYVQSNIGESYQLVKEQLIKGKIVLFTGTPCQVDGLLGFLGEKHTNLLTIDLICHGVPSTQFFQDYIAFLEHKTKRRIIEYDFRNKENGWGSYCYKMKSENIGLKTVEKLYYARRSSYFWLFLKGASHRPNCYQCKYASAQRVGDLTIGDFWGIDKEHPDYVDQSDEPLDINQGVSCILVNSENGRLYLEKSGDSLILRESSVEKVRKHNFQLAAPTRCHADYDEVMQLYAQNGYASISKWYKHHLGYKRYLYVLWDIIPRKMQLLIKKIKIIYRKKVWGRIKSIM